MIELMMCSLLRSWARQVPEEVCSPGSEQAELAKLNALQRHGVRDRSTARTTPIEQGQSRPVICSDHDTMGAALCLVPES